MEFVNLIFIKFSFNYNKRMNNINFYYFVRNIFIYSYIVLYHFILY